jgi:hypothetical protein
MNWRGHGIVDMRTEYNGDAEDALEEEEEEDDPADYCWDTDEPGLFTPEASVASASDAMWDEVFGA